MTSVYARTREREKAWKFGMYCLLGSLVVAPFWYLIFKKWVIGHNTFLKVHQQQCRTQMLAKNQKLTLTPDAVGFF